MAIGVMTVAVIVGAIVSVGGIVWLVLDKAYLISTELAGPVGDITESVKEVVTSTAGKIGVTGIGLILLGAGITAVFGLLKKK